MFQKLLSVLLFAITFIGVSNAQPEKWEEEHPCVQEICIGDSVDKLRQIGWQPVDYTSKRVERVSKSLRARRAKTFPGFGSDGVPSYLIVGLFDSDLLDDMERVKVACTPNEIRGTYLSKGGHKTDVRVSLMPVAGKTTMSWRVIGIGRMYSGFESNEQQAQLSQDLNARYGRFLNRQPSGAMVVPMGKEIALSLHWVDLARDKSFGNHGLCDRPKRISVD
ncbi:hypothetical protein K1X12_14570 [Hyphomonas sp. WL0036]|uniref:hypothetical protein n=1 Tax=Hyphomonas sediminis TaxID=2866160 RepID=UPI001C803BA8|nr:hypothetical protein [Hyphomonas sediminis]MBY9068132.1 hypothetical protein [Hyphomonas sediminis]